MEPWTSISTLSGVYQPKVLETFPDDVGFAPLEELLDVLVLLWFRKKSPTSHASRATFKLSCISSRLYVMHVSKHCLLQTLSKPVQQ